MGFVNRYAYSLEEAIDICSSATDENETVGVHYTVSNILWDTNPKYSFSVFILVKHLRLAIVEYEQFTTGPEVGIIRGCTN